MIPDQWFSDNHSLPVKPPEGMDKWPSEVRLQEPKNKQNRRLVPDYGSGAIRGSDTLGMPSYSLWRCAYYSIGSTLRPQRMRCESFSHPHTHLLGVKWVFPALER